MYHVLHTLVSSGIFPPLYLCEEHYTTASYPLWYVFKKDERREISALLIEGGTPLYNLFCVVPLDEIPRTSAVDASLRGVASPGRPVRAKLPLN